MMLIDGLNPCVCAVEARGQFRDDLGNGFQRQDQAGGNFLLAGLGFILHRHDDASACARDAYPSNARNVNVCDGHALYQLSAICCPHNTAPKNMGAYPSESVSHLTGGNNHLRARSGYNLDGTFWPRVRIRKEFQGSNDTSAKSASNTSQHFLSFVGGCIRGLVAAVAGHSLTRLAPFAARERAACRSSLCTGRAA